MLAAETSFVSGGILIGRWSTGIFRNCFKDMQETAAPVSNNHFDVMLHALMFKYGRLAILSESNATPKEHSDNIAETNILLFDSIFGDWPSVERRRRAGPAVSLSKNPDW